MLEGDYLKQVGLSRNPFITASAPELPIVEHDIGLKSLISYLSGGQKLIIVTSPIGYGKSTLVNLLKGKKDILTINNKKVKYICDFKVDVNKEVVEEDVRKSFPLLKRFFAPKNIVKFLNKNLGGDYMLLLFDEAQDYMDEKDLGPLLRAISDDVLNTSIIILGLDTIHKKLRDIESLRNREMIYYQLPLLPEKKVVEILVKRIKWAGGKGYGPFNEDAIKYVVNKSGLVPRAAIKYANEVFKYCAERDILEVTIKEVGEALSRIPESVMETPEVEIVREVGGKKMWDSLPDSHKDIINLLQANEKLTLTELVEKTGKVKQNVNRELKKMMNGYDYPLVVRTKEEFGGRRQFVYVTSEPLRRELATK